MRLRYLHLQKYPPIQDLAVRFASGSPLGRECAIRFVVGVNGSGKSNLLRAVAEVFLALAEERLPPFPVTLVYELGPRDTQRNHTFVVDCPGNKNEASLWVAENFHWPDDTTADQFEQLLGALRTGNAPRKFVARIQRGDWPQAAPYALPKAVLAYTTGDPRPWQSIWNRNQDSEGMDASASEEGEDNGEERPAGWTAAQEAALVAARAVDSGPPARHGVEPVTPSGSDRFRRPILLTPTLLKCALLAVALPQAFIETHDYPGRAEVDAAMAKFRRRADNKTPLQELLERGGWHHLVSVGFHCTLQTSTWRREILETAHDWLLCSSTVIAEPHPAEVRRILFFDLKESFDAQGLDTLTSNEELSACTTHGTALWSLLSGGNDVPPFELFARLMELHQSGLFDDVDLRLRRDTKPEAGSDLEARDQDIGVLRYEELSDGEQMMLGRMALFHLLDGQEDALLLLDEPETHFNDKWKREIVGIIDEAIGNTANDVLISTHSAIVLTDVFNEEIVLMERQGGAAVAHTVEDNTFAADPSELMIRIFGADDSVGQRAREHIESVIQQVEGTPEDIQRIKALIERLGSGFYRSELRTLINKWERNA